MTNKEVEYHISHMKPFFFNPLATDPLDVARKDYLEFFVEAIVNHKGDRKSRKNDLEFLIKWQGYDDKFNTWEPYAMFVTLKFVMTIWLSMLWLITSLPNSDNFRLLLILYISECI